MDGHGMVCAMADNVHELRPKAGDAEKITINLGHVDLGQIDLMVQDGFYSNRTDFIRTAIRNQLDRHADVVKQSVARRNLELGLRYYSREDLEAVRKARLKLAQRSRPSHPMSPPPDADRRRTAPSYYILTNLGQRDEPPSD